jgi:hypothetical protein
MEHYGEMRKMTEEKLTVAILKWLENQGWQIISFDFPQSGTGIVLHPNQDNRLNTKNKRAIIPDIIAHRKGVSVFFENKDRFVLSDLQKVYQFKTIGIYHEAIAEILKPYPTEHIYFGIGLPKMDRLEKKLNPYEDLVDFILLVNKDSEIEIFKGQNIF